jgi:hypothetical protein
VTVLGRHLARLLADVVRQAVGTRGVSILLLVLIGGVIVLVTLLAHTVGPVVVYPFL